MLAELAAGEKLATIAGAAAGVEAVVARENLPRLLDGAEARLSGTSGERLSILLEEWLRYQPPIALERLAAEWRLPIGAVEAALRPLAAAERVIVGELLEAQGASPVTQVATVGVVETLLRWRRAAARPAFQPLALTELPLFLASWQGLTDRGTGGEGLQSALERLFGFPAPAALWESDLLPARLEPYFPAWLDGLIEESELVWFGTGRERIAFAFRPDLDLFQSPATGSEGAAPGSPAEVVRGLIVREPRGLEVGELAERAGLPLATVTEALWALAWRGEATCTSLRVLRQGIQNGFRVEAPAQPGTGGGPGGGRGGRRGLFRRWQGSQPLAGRWRASVAGRAGDAGEAADPFVEEERSRERARLLLDRYGVLFRELLAAEVPALAWSRVARALRGLELAGEIVAGRFFEGVSGLQFAAPGALRRLRDGLPAGASWWCSALDPASPCGLELPGLQGTLPRRSASTRLAYRGSRLGAVFARGGREIHFAVPADDPGLPELLEPLRSALTRAVDAERGLDVEQINGEPAGSSSYFGAFAAFDRTRDGGLLRLRRRYAGRETGG